MSLLYCMYVYIMHICVFIKEYCSVLQQVEPRLIAYSVTVTLLSFPSPAPVAVFDIQRGCPLLLQPPSF